MSIATTKSMRFPRFFAAFAVALGAYAGSLASAAASVLINVNKSTQQMSVSVDGQTRWVWPVSTGRSGYATPGGSYGAFRMEEDHYSKEWDDAPMPHSIFFTKQGHAIHGTMEARRLGTAASHGCVRLSTKNAAQLFALVKQEGLGNTKVVIAGEQPVGAPAVAKRRPAVDDEEVADQLPPPRNIQPQGYYYQRPNYAYQPTYAPPARPSPYYYPPATASDYPSYPRPYYQRY